MSFLQSSFFAVLVSSTMGLPLCWVFFTFWVLPWELHRVGLLLCLASSAFIGFLPPGPALCKLGSARSAVLPEVLTPVLDLSLTFLCSIFEGFALPCLLATTILDSFSLF